MPDEPSTTPALRTCLVDAHVHLYACFDRGVFLKSAAENLRMAGRRRGEAGAPGVLMFTESAGDQAFHELACEPPAGWSASPSGEAASLSLAHADHGELVVISGRQIITSEGLEVLGLGMGDAVPDGAPAREVIAAVLAEGALPVLPWAVGKWIGSRGAIVEELAADTTQFPELYFGDNSGRPAFWRTPTALTRATQAGRLVLPGTDPLPIPREAAAPGRFGFIARTAFDPARPFGALRDWLRALAVSPPAYGSLESPVRFVLNQTTMQMRKRLKAA